MAPVAAPRKSVRTSLARLVLIPAAALLALWGTAATLLVTEAVQLYGARDSAVSAGRQGQAVLARLQDERRITSTWQVAPRRDIRAELLDARSRTDAAVGALHEASADPESADATEKARADRLRSSLAGLSEQREVIDKQKLSRYQAVQYYTRAITQGTQWLRAATQVDDGDVSLRADELTSVLDLTEALAREDTWVSDALASDMWSPDVQGDFAQYLAVKRQTRAVLDSQELSGEQARAYRRITGSAEWGHLESFEKDLTTRANAAPQQAAWRKTTDAVVQDLRELGSSGLKNFDEEVTGRAEDLVLTAAVGTVVALTALVTTAVLTRRFSRALTGRLLRLHRTTTELADTRLPRLVKELEQGKDPSPSESRDPEHGDDELGRLAVAQQHLEHTVRAILLQQTRGQEDKEALFLGLARRTQVLVNRLIPKLDELERKHQDSDLLKDIFAVDHLATRMRRHNENLMIIGGSPPVRRWSKSVPVYEVVRSAISETQDYGRVEAQPAPSASLVGPAVSDVVHLLAELIENGTAFSPPDTKVSVTALTVARGLVLEVEDRGLGMPDSRYEECNKMLAEPPKLDMTQLGETPRLGLFVVALLAQRRNLEVHLRKSPYGGTRAIVLLPSALLEETQPLLGNIIPQQPQEAQAAIATQPATEVTSEPHEVPMTAAVGESSAEYPPSPFGSAEHTPSPSGSPEYSPPSFGSAGYTPSSFGADGGFPSYGGEGLLPGPGAQVADGGHQYAPDTPGRPPERTSTSGGHTMSARSEISQDPSTDVEFPAVLPTRVRGESLAAQLRQEARTFNAHDDDARAISPERAGFAIGAIQAANKRALPSTSARATGSGPSRPAAEPDHGTRPEDHRERDQR